MTEEKKASEGADASKVFPQAILYCRADLFSEDGGNLWGNWTPSSAAACTGLDFKSTLPKVAYKVDDLGACDDGNGLKRAAPI